MSFHSVVIQKLLNANAHLGRRVTEHHFKIFTEGSRNSMSIIDSDKTLICIRNACNFIGQLARLDGRFLFVNTNSLFDEIISQMTQITKIKNDTTWRLSGFLTNISSPKKFRGRNKKFNLVPAQAPDCIVIFDTQRKSSVIREAAKLHIPVVGLVDSSMPWETYRRITYPVPANDSVEFVYLFCNLITKTILKEQQKAMAEAGESTIREDVEQDNQTVAKDKFFVRSYESLWAVPDDELKQLLDKVVVLKFNGITGSKMGFHGPMCLMEIGSGMTCLDLIINQINGINSKYGCDIPLFLVNEAGIHDDIMQVLVKHPNKNVHVMPVSQHRQVSDFASPLYKRGSFNLPEVFSQLMDSGKLDDLLSQGKEYVLLLSADNIAHLVDPKILYHLVRNKIQYCVEVIPKLSESEKSSLSEEKEVQDPMHKRNLKFINKLWIEMDSIEDLVAKEDLGISKLVDQSFAVSVPQSRHLPVESTSDLLLLKSDLYSIVDGILTRNSIRETFADPSIELGPEFQNVDDFHKRFKSIPSVVELDSLKVTGDVWFGTDITLKGEVHIHASQDRKLVIPDGILLENAIITSQEDIGEAN